METRKIGYIAAGLMTVLIIIGFLISNGTIKVDIASQMNIILLLVPAGLIFLGFCLLVNSEHLILSIIDFVCAGIFTLIVVLTIIMDPNDLINITKFIMIIEEGIMMIAAINIPFIIRTQSKIHRYFKYLVALIITVTGVIAVSAFSTLGSDTKAKTLEDYEKAYKSYQKKVEIVGYGVLASFIGIVCNPMIGYASSDGLGGGSSKGSPKLVPRNNATDPNMSDGLNPNQGINYGDMPVPDGVVANPSPTLDTAPEVLPTVEPSIASSPVQTPEMPIAASNTIAPATPIDIQTQPVAAVPNPAPVAEPTVAPAPAVPETNTPVAETSLNANDVAPELQFLLNNNNNK